MKELDALRAELDCWGAAGREATLWWRDDDAETADGPVQRMLDLSAKTEAPVFIAVVPGRAVDPLGPAMNACATAVPIQHGWMHQDHSPADVKGKWELGLHRPLAEITNELACGFRRMGDLFGPRFLPMIGPPWNRIAPEVTAALPAIGLRWLSTFAPRETAHPASGLTQINGHCDIISWRRDRSFIGAEKTGNRLAEHLAARRTGAVQDEPTGLLTHVWINDEPAWTALEAVLDLVRHHPSARWLGAADFA